MCVSVCVCVCVHANTETLLIRNYCNLVEICVMLHLVPVVGLIRFLWLLVSYSNLET